MAIGAHGRVMLKDYTPRMWARAVGILATVALAQGCIASSVVLHVRSDGSGRATISTRLYLSSMRAFDAIFAGQGDAPRRPPQIEEELPAPGQGVLEQTFGTPIRLISSKLDLAPDGGIRTTEIEFDDIRGVQLIFPPVFATSGGHFSLSGISEMPLVTFAIRPHDNGDRLLVVKLPNAAVSNAPDAPVTVFESDSQEERLMKQAIKNMSVKLFVEIEQPLLRSNAPRREGSRATIVDLDLDKMINAMDEPRVRRMMAPGSFQEMLWQVGDLPGAIVPTDQEVFLEYEQPQQTAPPAATPAPAQAPPDTEIYLAPLKSANGTITLGDPINISNSPGYDTQPSFTPDGDILFTSARGPSPGLRDGAPPGQTDIYRYRPEFRRVVRVTQTP